MPPFPLTYTLDNILQQADRCVKCGLCLPYCPTYEISHNENESPRGRIALMQGLAANQLTINDTLTQHLDHCLGCRRCERVCPSGVHYGRMLDETRHWINQRRPNTGLSHWLSQKGFDLLRNKRKQAIAYRLLRFYQRSGLRILCRYSGLLQLLRLHRLERLLPDLPRRSTLKNVYPTSGDKRGHVALFTGCLSTWLDQRTLHGGIRILNLLGYDVTVSSGQTCCGALHLHHGDTESACELAKRNIQAIEPDMEIVYLATGCGAQLTEYGRLPWTDAKSQASAQRYADRAVEITEFITRHDLKSLNLRSLRKDVTIHTPCSSGNGNATRHLLGQIPDIRLSTVQADSCCGSAGSYMLTQNTLAKQIRSKTIGQIFATGAEIITTTNIGCALHIKEGLPTSAIVLHPVELFVTQLEK